MGARAITALALAAGLAIAQSAWAQVDAFTVLFLDGEDQIVRLKEARAIAYDKDGKPLFEAGVNYIRAYAENPSGRVYEWDPSGKRVRVSPDGIDEVWLRCDALKRMTVACGPRLRIDGAVIFVGEGEIPEAPVVPPPPPPPPPAPDADPGSSPYGTLPNGSGTGQGYGLGAGPNAGRGLPVCPGDPRCKKVKGG